MAPQSAIGALPDNIPLAASVAVIPA